MRNFLWLTIPVLIFLMFSCQAPWGPEDLTETEELSAEEIDTELRQVESIDEGKFVSKKDTIPVEIDLKLLEEEPSELVINLTDTEGTILASQKHFFDGEEEKVHLPDIVLPEIPEGQYILNYLFYNEEGEFFYEEKVSFFYITQTYEITGIWSFPNAIHPRSTAMLRAGINAPEESNPYLRWKVGDSIVSEGYYSEGAQEFSWGAPEIEGIYTVTLELYPIMPEEELTFSSEIQMSTEIYVTSEPEPEKNELQPEEHYYSLFHFRGNNLDAGYRTNAGKASFSGNPEMKLEGETYGYYLDGTSGFTVQDLLLPTEEQRLLPFSLVIRGIFDPFTPNRDIFSSSTSDGSFSFRVGTDANGLLRVVVRNGGESAESVLSAEETAYFQNGERKPETVIISLVPSSGTKNGDEPETEALVVLWYTRETFLHRELLSVSPQLKSGTGTALLGGKNGAAGLIDEFGIFHNRQGTESNIIESVYENSLEEEYGLDLRFAEGFDSFSLPENLSYSGDVSLQNGKAVLQPESSFQLPRLLLRNETADTIVEIAGEVPAQEGFICRTDFPGTDIPPLILDFTGKLSIGENEISVPSFSNRKKIEFALIHNTEGVILKIGEKQFPVFEKPGGSVDVVISLQNGTEKTVFIESVSVISTSEEIVQKAREEQPAEQTGGDALQDPENDDSSVAAGGEGESQTKETIL